MRVWLIVCLMAAGCDTDSIRGPDSLGFDGAGDMATAADMAKIGPGDPCVLPFPPSAACCWGKVCPLTLCAQPTDLPDGADDPGACCEPVGRFVDMKADCCQYYRTFIVGVETYWRNCGAGFICYSGGCPTSG